MYGGTTGKAKPPMADSPMVEFSFMTDSAQGFRGSRDYELFVFELLNQNMSGIVGVELVETIHDVRMRGLSGHEHQIDIAYRFRIWATEFLVLVECKHYKNRVGVEEVLEFRSRIEDLRANKGVLVTSSDFQKGAIEVAKANRIALIIVRGTKALGFEGVTFSWTPPSWPEMRQILHDHILKCYGGDSGTAASRISMPETSKGVLVTIGPVRLEIEPYELNMSFGPERTYCSTQERDNDKIYLSRPDLGMVSPNGLVKSLLLEEIFREEANLEPSRPTLAERRTMYGRLRAWFFGKEGK